MMTVTPAYIAQQVETALAEDIGDGDLTASLIPKDKTLSASVITREQAVICGTDWVNTVFKQLDPNCRIRWNAQEGDCVDPNTVLFEIEGQARAMLTGERTALNFLQFLSGISTQAHTLSRLVAHTEVMLLDTRKTLPMHRLGQKYAVKVGGCDNHRIGLFDAYLIKENHIAACGGIAEAISLAKTNRPGASIQVEVENESELQQSIEAGAHIAMLDNFDLEGMRSCVQKYKGQILLEASGGIDAHNLVAIAETGIDRISIGGLTKHCQAIDLSMRFKSN